MSHDVTSALSSAMKRPWSKSRGVQLLSAVAASIPGATSDWDQGADEDWGRCLDGRTVVAYVGMKWPILILVAKLKDVAVLGAHEVEIIVVDSMEASDLRVDNDILLEFAGRVPAPNVFRTDAFCADDLVWLTI